MSRLNPEDLAIALAVQDEQRRLGVRVQSVEEIAGITDPPRRQRQAPRPFGNQPVAVKGQSNVVPLVRGAEPSIAATMNSNFVVSVDAMRQLNALEMTPAQRAQAAALLFVLGGELPLDSCRVLKPAKELAEAAGLTVSYLHKVLVRLEEANLIHRPRGEGGRATAGIYLNPRYIARCRAARHADVMAEYKAAGGRQAGE